VVLSGKLGGVLQVVTGIYIFERADDATMQTSATVGIQLVVERVA
jgi:hypothetical protein